MVRGVCFCTRASRAGFQFNNILCLVSANCRILFNSSKEAADDDVNNENDENDVTKDEIVCLLDLDASINNLKRTMEDSGNAEVKRQRVKSERASISVNEDFEGVIREDNENMEAPEIESPEIEPPRESSWNCYLDEVMEVGVNILPQSGMIMDKKIFLRRKYIYPRKNIHPWIQEWLTEASESEDPFHNNFANKTISKVEQTNEVQEQEKTRSPKLEKKLNETRNKSISGLVIEQRNEGFHERILPKVQDSSEELELKLRKKDWQISKLNFALESQHLEQKSVEGRGEYFGDIRKIKVLGSK